ncbi:hypothetical protein [Enterobacter cloacae]|uniref:hypothetical protein n=1 Tax=Enterobacter cloacae TaxID=550 RepID=UPI002FFD09E7
MLKINALQCHQPINTSLSNQANSQGKVSVFLHGVTSVHQGVSAIEIKNKLSHLQTTLPPKKFPLVDKQENENQLIPECKTFNTSPLGGNPVGRTLNVPHPLPAQASVFQSVINEKVEQLRSGKELKAIDVWKNPQTGKVHILDGQHRFIAAAQEGVEIKLNWKKFGFPPNQLSWKETFYSNDTPAKNIIKSQISRPLLTGR